MKRTYVFNGSSVVEKPADQGVYAPPKAYWTEPPPDPRNVRPGRTIVDLVEDAWDYGNTGRPMVPTSITEAAEYLTLRLAALEAFVAEVRDLHRSWYTADAFIEDVGHALARVPERP